MYGKVARPAVQYGERQRPERLSVDLLIMSGRYVPYCTIAIPYMHLQTAIVSGYSLVLQSHQRVDFRRLPRGR